MPRRLAAGALLLLAGCRESVGPSTAGRGSLPPEFNELSIEQKQLLARPVSAEARAGRPATLQDLQEVQGWFAPGELQAVLAIVNRRAAARGEDTLPHCTPLCGHPATRQ